MSVAVALLIGFAMLDQPVITPFAHGKSCAFSMEFDDSMTSQVTNLLPLLKRYRFPVTFFVNPAREDYVAAREIWEKEIPEAGHEIGDHTMHHRDTIGAEQAESEIGEAAKILHRVVGKESLMPFAIPGGVKWEIPNEEFERILRENHLFLPGREAFYQDGQEDITRFPRQALDSNSWHRLGFHGVGGQWLSTSVETMTTLFEFLKHHENTMWIAPTGVVWKYQREREAVTGTSIDAKGNISVHFDPSKLDPFELYDVPLTLQLSVDSSWSAAKVTIDGRERRVPVRDSKVQFDVVPQARSIHLSRADR